MTAAQRATRRHVTIREDLRVLCERAVAAERRLHVAQVRDGDREAAEDERRAALGEHFAAGQAIADLGLLVVRHALAYRQEALAAYLADALRPELQAIADAITRLEGR